MPLKIHTGRDLPERAMWPLLVGSTWKAAVRVAGDASPDPHSRGFASDNEAHLGGTEGKHASHPHASNRAAWAALARLVDFPIRGDHGSVLAEIDSTASNRSNCRELLIRGMLPPDSCSSTT